MNPGYILGIGSNLEPEKHAALIIEHLARRFGELRISRIYYTAPEAVASSQAFVNFCAYVPTELPPPEFKAECVAIEEALGRDRSHPLRKVLDRSADLDVLARLTGQERQLAAETLCPAAYLAQPLRELLAELALAPAVAARGGLCRISLAGEILGEAPAAVHRDDRAGLVVVR